MFTKRHLRLFTVLLLSMLFASAACSKGEHEKPDYSDSETEMKSAEDGEIVFWNRVCPVCGADVSAEIETVTYDGKVYGFGCAGCPDEFKENPENYVKNLNEDGTKFIGA